MLVSPSFKSCKTIRRTDCKAVKDKQEEVSRGFGFDCVSRGEEETYGSMRRLPDAEPMDDAITDQSHALAQDVSKAHTHLLSDGSNQANQRRGGGGDRRPRFVFVHEHIRSEAPWKKA
jgi:hypothetical protein